MVTLRCRACETTYHTAVIGPHLDRLAQLGCEACGAAEPLRPGVRAVSAAVDGVDRRSGEGRGREW